MYNDVCSFPHTHLLSHCSCPEVDVVFSYKTQTPSCQSTVSRCNITRSIQTLHTAVTPHYHTIISHKPPRPILSVFSVRLKNIVTVCRPQRDFVPRSYQQKLRNCELTYLTVRQPCTIRRHKKVDRTLRVTLKWRC